MQVESLTSILFRNCWKRYWIDTAEKLRSVYGTLGSRLQVQTRETEVTALAALVAALLLLAAGTLSVLWFRRLT